MTPLATSTFTPPRAATSVASPPGGDILRDCREFLIGRLSSVLVECDAPAAQTVPALRRGFGAFFDEMVSDNGQTEFEQAGNLTASKIKLVDDSQLEFSIALAGVAKRLGESVGREYPKLHLRVMTLLDVDELDATSNPVGPQAVCAGLDEVCGALGDDLDGMLEQLRVFEAALARALPLVYAELNERLVRSAVPPRQIMRNHHDAGLGGRPGDSSGMAPAGPATHGAAPSGSAAALYAALRTRGSGGGAGGAVVTIDAGALRGLFAALDRRKRGAQCTWPGGVGVAGSAGARLRRHP
jgi:hypothetical protein